MGKAIAYIRCACNSDAEKRIEEQRIKITAFANENNYDIAEWVIDSNISGIGKKPALDKIIKRGVGEADTLLVTSVDRLSRHQTELLLTLEELDKLGYTVIATNHPTPLNEKLKLFGELAKQIRAF